MKSQALPPAETGGSTEGSRRSTHYYIFYSICLYVETRETQHTHSAQEVMSPAKRRRLSSRCDPRPVGLVIVTTVRIDSRCINSKP
jgi:hypothetical protein